MKKRGIQPRLAVHPEFTAHQPDQAGADRKPESRTVRSPLVDLRLFKSIENTFSVLLTDANSCISNRKIQDG